jgi:alternate signal-mediated exported protein
MTLCKNTEYIGALVPQAPLPPAAFGGERPSRHTESETTMDKSTKGALAAVAAGLLLAGTAGSLAYWNATGSVDGGDIDSGKLALINPGALTWTLNGNPASGSVVLVPGDELVFSGSFEIDAAGDNLQADVGLSGGGGSGSLAPYVTTDVAATIAGSPVTQVTEANDGETIDVQATIDFPFGSSADNDSQSKTLDLSDIAVTLTQTDATP